MASGPTFHDRLEEIRRELSQCGGGIDPDPSEINDDVTTLAGAVRDLADLMGELVGERHARTGTEPYVERFAAPQVAGIEIDTDTLGNALERGLDDIAMELKNALEQGLSDIAKAVERWTP